MKKNKKITASTVDATMADLGVEGKVVAGAFEGYCDAGYSWVPGSAKYGTLPGFCVMADLAKTSPQPSPWQGEGVPLLTKEGNANVLPLAKGEIKEGVAWTNVSQGEAQVACQSLGNGYHLLGENEWLTIAANILTVAANDIDPVALGRQLATSSSPLKGEAGVRYTLTNDNIINNLTGTTTEWTNQNVTAAGLPVAPSANAWL